MMSEPLTDAQGTLFRARLEELAEAQARSPSVVRSAEIAEMLLLLVDRIDTLEKRIRDEGAA
jgi:hypothetical protein